MAAVNALLTGMMIVFRILEVTAAVKPTTSVERTLSSIGGMKFRRIMSVVIESCIIGALFAIQMVRGRAIPVPVGAGAFLLDRCGRHCRCHQRMLNEIIVNFIHFFFCFSDNIYLVRASHTNDNIGAGFNEIVLRRWRTLRRRRRNPSILLDPNASQQMGSSNSFVRWLHCDTTQ